MTPATPQTGPAPHAPIEPEPGSVSPLAIGATAVVLGALWRLDLVVLRTPWLTSFRKHPPLTPLYAFVIPVVRWEALGFALLAVLLVGVAGWLASPERVGRLPFALGLFTAGVLLPAALFLVRQPFAELGSQFLIYPREEFWADAARVQDLAQLWRHYVEWMPDLSLHGQVYPPGYTTLLYLVRQASGPGPVAAGVIVLLCGAAGIVLAYVGLLGLAGESAARQGALLLLACPSLLDFSCTSMDAVFFLCATGAWALGVRAGGPGGSDLGAFATGAVLLGATCFSFSTFPVGLAVALFTLAAGRRAPGRALRRLAGIGVGYVAAAAALQAGTGFSVLACLQFARERAVTLMTAELGRDPRTLYADISYGNLVAFLLGAGLALVPAVAVGVGRRRATEDAWTMAALPTLVGMGVGGLYVMETERVWLFALPWLAAIAVSRGALRVPSLRLLLALGLAQTLAMEIGLFTLW